MSGRQWATVIERVPIGHGDYADGDLKVRSGGWSFQPMTPAEQEQMGLQVTRRWRTFGPAVPVPAVYQLEVDDLLDEDGARLRLDVHGALEVWPARSGAAHHVEGIVEIVEGVSR